MKDPVVRSLMAKCLAEYKPRFTALEASDAPVLAQLREILRTGQPRQASGAVGLVSRLDVGTLLELLPVRLPEWNRCYHDVVVRQQARRACFRLKTRDQFRARESSPLFAELDRLYRNRPADHRIGGLVDDTHSAAAKFGNDFVTPGFEN